MRPTLSVYCLLPVLLAFCSLLSGCDGEEEKPEESIIIGAIYNLTGAQSELDVPSSQGARLAVDEANRGGGVLGRRVELIVEDGKTIPEVIRAVTAKTLDRRYNIAGLIGLSDTDMLLAAAPIAAGTRRIFVTSGATSPKLPDQIPDYLFLACFGDNVQAAAAAEWAFNDRSARAAAVVYNADHAYTRLLQGYFTQRFEQLGGKAPSVTSYPASGLQDMAEISREVDVIFLAAGDPDEARRAIQMMREAGYTQPIVGGDSYDSEELWKKHPEIGNVFFTTHAWLSPENPDPDVVAFIEAYGKAYPGTPPTAFSALGYDAARLLMKAVADAGSDNPQEVLKALATVQGFEGVTGTISYSNGSRIPTKSVTILEVGEGAVTLAKQFTPEVVPAP